VWTTPARGARGISRQQGARFLDSLRSLEMTGVQALEMTGERGGGGCRSEWSAAVVAVILSEAQRP
jgi:hypothetical protein